MNSLKRHFNNLCVGTKQRLPYGVHLTIRSKVRVYIIDELNLRIWCTVNAYI